ncbi:class I SAM-dependent methyltransferase (plasmid) [Ensifer adhaerens]|uniref:class I SAM-dependent methyltransferase n=1 Tax=Ensifer adhaerens TaxID=106592 RepID=UPI00210100FD|nr:class I SAM-dependent methyltransferase [Ensifer adhaerens]UTV41809.1 class I SAM-dependent methyltransferase [Ensifer adhaerens]
MSKADTDLSWYEETPALSLALLRAAGLSPDKSIIDIGGGASHLVDALLSVNQAHITVLDISAAALEKTRTQLQEGARVNWVVSDVTAWKPDRRYDFWHDRAAFHFLTSEDDQRSYVRVLEDALNPGSKAIIGTFALDGPEECSGLPVARYDAEGLQQVLGSRFELSASCHHEHVTPWGSVQRFQFGTFVKV